MYIDTPKERMLLLIEVYVDTERKNDASNMRCRKEHTWSEAAASRRRACPSEAKWLGGRGVRVACRTRGVSGVKGRGEVLLAVSLGQVLTVMTDSFVGLLVVEC